MAGLTLGFSSVSQEDFQLDASLSITESLLLRSTVGGL